MYEDIIRDKSTTSSASFKFFIENYDKFKPLKKITVFFDGENFLITKYKVENEAVHMVIENWNGQEIHINNLNCGYAGSGPSHTERLLKYLGMNSNQAENIKLNDGIQIGFTKDGQIDNNDIKTEIFFGDSIRKGNYKFSIDDNSHIDLNRKKLYILNPQLLNFKGLLSAIDIMVPREIEYYIGTNSPLENSFRFNNDFMMFRGDTAKYDYEKIKGATQVNLIIRGEVFDIVCLIKRTDLMVVLNTIHLYLFNEELFINKPFGNYSTISLIENLNTSLIIKYCLKKILNKEEADIHEVIKIEWHGEEMEKWKLRL